MSEDLRPLQEWKGLPAPSLQVYRIPHRTNESLNVATEDLVVGCLLREKNDHQRQEAAVGDVSSITAAGVKNLCTSLNGKWNHDGRSQADVDKTAPQDEHLNMDFWSG